MTKLDANKQLKKDSLLNTAFELFTTKGISKTSISDIAHYAGVAKGTFYLYFKDKYDIRNKLISHKSSEIFRNARESMRKSATDDLSFEDRLILLTDSIINQLDENKSLLNFISKNLSWGIFKNALTTPESPDDINFEEIYVELLENSPIKFKDPEIMLFMIVELVSSTCYSSILYSEPVSLAELKPYLYSSIKFIISNHKI